MVPTIVENSYFINLSKMIGWHQKAWPVQECFPQQTYIIHNKIQKNHKTGQKQIL